MENLEAKQQRLLRAGLEYEAILEMLRDQQKQYLRLQTTIGVRESHANAGGERIIALPEFPSLGKQERQVADHLVAMTANLIERPFRVAPFIDKRSLASMVALRDGSQIFSPVKLAEELIEEFMGERGQRRAEQRAAKALDSQLGRNLRAGQQPVIEPVHRVRVDGEWRLDPMSSLLLADLLINMTAVAEETGLAELLKGIDAQLQAIEHDGHAIVGAGALVREGEYQIYPSAKQHRLVVHLSSPLRDALLSFIERHGREEPDERAGDGW